MSGYAAYPEYRDSGVVWLDEVPSSWSVDKLKNFALVFPSNVDKKSVAGEPPVKLCNYTDVYYNDEINTSICFMKATASTEQVEKFALLYGDTIITKDSEDPADIAVPAFVVETLPGVVCGYHLSVVRPNRIEYGKYINYIFKTAFARAYFHTRANGLTRYGIGSYAVLNVECPRPSVEEAMAITNFLDHETAKIDTLIEKQQQLIKLLKEKRQAVISHAVTKGLNPGASMKDSGVEWLGEVPAGWDTKAYRYATKIYRGKFGFRPRNHPSLYDGPFPFIQTGDIARANVFIRDYKQTLNEQGRAVSEKFPAGTLVMAIAANIGDTAILDFEAYAPDSVVGFLPTQGINLEFLRLSLTAALPALEQTSTQSTQANLNIDRIGSVIAAFPDQDEQLQITDYVNSQINNFDELEIKAGEVVQLLFERRTALISAAVTGKIDVRNWQPPEPTSTSSMDA